MVPGPHPWSLDTLRAGAGPINCCSVVICSRGGLISKLAPPWSPWQQQRCQATAAPAAVTERASERLLCRVGRSPLLIHSHPQSRCSGWQEAPCPACFPKDQGSELAEWRRWAETSVRPWAGVWAEQAKHGQPPAQPSHPRLGCWGQDPSSGALGQGRRSPKPKVRGRLLLAHVAS